MQIGQSAFYGVAGKKDDGSGTLLSKYFHEGASPQNGNDRMMYDPATGKLVYDADGNGTGFAAVHFATLPSGLGLTAGNFFLVPSEFGLA